MARNPYRRGGLATDPPELDAQQGEPVDAEPEPETEPEADEPAAEDPVSGGSRSFAVPSLSPAAQAGAGWVLGLLLWAWFARPFITGGPAEVKAVLRAKFLNQAADGSELP